MKKKILIFLAIIILSVGLFIIKEVKAGTEHNVYGWAWSENIGWISFNSTSGGGPTNYGVHICASESDSLCALVSAPKTGKLIGYAWSRGTSNDIGGIGWIKFDPAGPYPASPNYSACLDLPGAGQTCDGVGDYTVSGWARAYRAIAPEGQTLGGWDGWIRLKDTNYGLWLDSSVTPTEFRDWAWGSDVVGWISFNTLNVGGGVSSEIFGPAADNTSIAKGSDGFPVVTGGTTAGNLRVCHCSNLDCTSVTCNTLNSDINSGSNSSIAIGADNCPVISGLDFANDALRVCHCSNAACSSANCNNIDSASMISFYPSSIAIGSDNLPVISVNAFDWNSGTSDLIVCHCSNAACSSANCYTVDSVGDVGPYNSIAIGTDGYPVISYQDYYPNYNLKVCHCSNAACSSANCYTVDSVGDVGFYTSIAIGADNYPIISEIDAASDGTSDLRVCHCSNTACTSADCNTIYSVSQSAGNNIQYTSIAIGSDNLPVISASSINYGGYPAGDLIVCHCSNTACTSAVCNTIDSGIGGGMNSITIGSDGYPVISYYNATGENLKVCHCSDTSCTSCGTSASDYKVMTDLTITPPNNRPYVEPGSAVIEYEEYCSFSPTGRVGFKWQYQDDEGDVQLKYNLQIDGTDSSFNNLVLNNETDQSVSVGGYGTAAVNIVQSPSGPLDIGYNNGNPYYWRVRVMAATGNPSWSAPEQGPSFSPPSHPRPNCSFTPQPANPQVDQVVNFIDNSLCYTAGGSYNCKDNTFSLVSPYKWDFDYPPFGPDATLPPGNTSYTYSSASGYSSADNITVRLEVTDDVGMCPREVSFTLGAATISLPKWKEIAPF